MLDSLFSFLDPIIEPIEDEENVFSFIAQVEALFEYPEQFPSEYQRLKKTVDLHLSEEGQKLLDMQIGLTLIGQEGRELMAKRIRLIFAKYKIE